jgi:hypothetical protein
METNYRYRYGERQIHMEIAARISKDELSKLEELRRGGEKDE